MMCFVQVEIATQHLIAGQKVEDWFPIRKGNKVSKQILLLSFLILFNFKKFINSPCQSNGVLDGVTSLLKYGSLDSSNSDVSPREGQN